MEESLQIRRLIGIPSPEEFASQIEQKNVPAVIGGCAKEWKAFSKWSVSNGGLDYLQELVGSSVVEAMLSRSAPVFNGDIRGHERVPLPFSTFIGYCKDLLLCKDDGQDSISQLRKHEPMGVANQQVDFALEEESPKQIYLAQVPIINTENEEKSQLECLKDDIQTPSFLDNKILASVNLWMNNARSRSSTHYDPHHNLLCIISGSKQGTWPWLFGGDFIPEPMLDSVSSVELSQTCICFVVLWPPSACPVLYPLPVYGESSNHSAVPLENTNFSLYPRAKSIDEFSHKVTLHAGDALFIPEGWFHQVDSEDLTMAVNFWWRSDMMSGMPEHMDAYYLRRIMKRLTDKEMDRMLSLPSTTKLNCMIGASGQSSNQNAGGCDEDLRLNHQKVGEKEKLEQMFSLRELEPHELRPLHELVSLVHERMNYQPTGSIPADQSVSREEEDMKKIVKANMFNLEDDPIANIVWKLEPHAFESIFLTMAHNFPRTLEAFVLHALSPVGVEVLTRKFEQMDKRIAPDERNKFYQKFYSVFDNQFSAMDALLNGKESFACQAFNNVLVQYLGINLDGPKPSLE